MISYGRQSIDDEDIAAVVEALRSDYLTTGPRVEAFERALADYCGARHAVAVSSGTAALHLAMLAAGLRPGNRVLTSANTFLASANCVEFVGATTDFADIDPFTYNVTVDTLRAVWRDDVRAVVAVDFAGQPCDMPAIHALARERGALVIEDAAHSLGSAFEHRGRRCHVGGHPWADMTTFSFHPVKTVTTGEGGAILTDDDHLAERCRLLRSHGMIRPQVGVRESSAAASVSSSCPLLADRGPWFYEMAEVGFNYRITDLQCALGISQLRRLDGFIRRRQEIVASYNAAFRALPCVICPRLSVAQSANFSLHPSDVAWHLYVLQVEFGDLGTTRTRMMGELKARGVGTQVHYIPVHLQPYYRNKYGYNPGKCPVAEAYYRRCLSLPLYSAMSDTDVACVVAAVRQGLQA